MQAFHTQSHEAANSAPHGPSRESPNGDSPRTEQTLRKVSRRGTGATESGASEPRPAAFRGASPGFSIPNLLQFLGTNRKTGTLHVKSEAEDFSIAMDDGLIVHASSTPRPIEERLGSILLQRDLVESDTLGDLIERSRETNTRLGDALHERGLVSTEDLQSALTLQIERMFQRLFGTLEASFEFFEEDPEKHSFRVRIGVMELLLENARAADEAR